VAFILRVLKALAEVLQNAGTIRKKVEKVNVE
jgi:hypothetical protein